MPHLRDISGGKPLRPGAINGRDESLVAIGTDDNGLAAQISNLQNAALTHNLDARVVSVIARANAGDAAQRAVRTSSNSRNVTGRCSNKDVVAANTPATAHRPSAPVARGRAPLRMQSRKCRISAT